jgi:hypothetical protein
MRKLQGSRKSESFVQQEVKKETKRGGAPPKEAMTPTVTAGVITTTKKAAAGVVIVVVWRTDPLPSGQRKLVSLMGSLIDATPPTRRPTTTRRAKSETLGVTRTTATRRGPPSFGPTSVHHHHRHNCAQWWRRMIARLGVNIDTAGGRIVVVARSREKTIGTTTTLHAREAAAPTTVILSRVANGQQYQVRRQR